MFVCWTACDALLLVGKGCEIHQWCTVTRTWLRPSRDAIINIVADSATLQDAPNSSEKINCFLDDHLFYFSI